MLEFNIDLAQVITLLIGIVLPILVGLVTKVTTHAGAKAVLLALLALVSSLLTEFGAALASGTPYDLGAGLIAALGTFLIAVSMHFGLWKPLGVSTAVQRFGDNT